MDFMFLPLKNKDILRDSSVKNYTDKFLISINCRYKSCFHYLIFISTSSSITKSKTVNNEESQNGFIF